MFLKVAYFLKSRRNGLRVSCSSFAGSATVSGARVSAWAEPMATLSSPAR